MTTADTGLRPTSARPGSDPPGPALAQVADQPAVWIAADSVAAALARGPIAQPDAVRAQAMPRWRREEFLAARALLRGLLRWVAGPAAQAPVDADDRGRPFLRDWPELGISISHDSGFVAVAVARGTDVGVDIQAPPSQLDEHVMRRCLGRHFATVHRQPRQARIRTFTWVWTVQEACVKASGAGLAGCPWTIDVAPGAPSGQWRDIRWTIVPGLVDIPLSCAFVKGADELCLYRP